MNMNLPALGAIGDAGQLRTVFYQSGQLVHGPYGLSSLGVSAFAQTLLDDANAATARATLGVGDEAVRYDSAQSLSASEQAQARANISAPLKGHLYGLTLSNNATDATNDIDIATGEAASTETNPVLMVLDSAITKQLDAEWAVGTGNGGLDTGTVANTTYHVWLIRRSDTGVVDALFSTSATSPTMPSPYDQKRRIGSILRISGTIVPFTQSNRFFLIQPVQDINDNNPGTSAKSYTLTRIPVGINVEALLGVGLLDTTSGGVVTGLISSLEQTAASPVAANLGNIHIIGASGAVAMGGIDIAVLTNTSAQIRSQITQSNADISVRITVKGWVDPAL